MPARLAAYERQDWSKPESVINSLWGISIDLSESMMEVRVH